MDSFIARDFALASMLAAYPDAEVEATATATFAVLVDHPGVGPIVRFVAEHGWDTLRSTWLEVFEQGKDRVSLYETEYGRMRGMRKGNDLADIAGFYRAFALELDDVDVHEMLDHLAVELEFYAMLLSKQRWLAETGDVEGTEIVEDGRRKFLADHLGSFVPAIVARPKLQECSVYGPLLSWCADLVARECTALGVVPAPLDYFGDGEQEREMRCGSLPVLQ
ncbi:MAG: molecular chaperone TorD family protein [Deltaproteobacteria bacterium]|nr:molecular chaperone TorD family protein [Deltaproteobacteria bacterium]